MSVKKSAYRPAEHHSESHVRSLVSHLSQRTRLRATALQQFSPACKHLKQEYISCLFVLNIFSKRASPKWADVYYHLCMLLLPVNTIRNYYYFMCMAFRLLLSFIVFSKRSSLRSSSSAWLLMNSCINSHAELDSNSLHVHTHGQ